jgi:hypothetical protein
MVVFQSNAGAECRLPIADCKVSSMVHHVHDFRMFIEQLSDRALAVGVTNWLRETP